MKKVLWICNIMLPAIAREQGLPYSNREGWLSGIFDRIQSVETFCLGVAFPLSPADQRRLQAKAADMSAEEEVCHFQVKGMDCYAFAENLSTPEIYDPGLERQLSAVFQNFQPDIIHVFGTEFPHALAAVRACGDPQKLLLGIQGLCGKIAEVYQAGLPRDAAERVTFRDIIRKDSIRRQQEKFRLRGEHEAEAIRGAGYLTGRTSFDREETARLNPKARYFFMNETMRREFYDGAWDQEKCQSHSIFLSQGDYPLKGMHFVLETMARLLPDFPDLKLYVAGNSVIGHSTFKERLKLPAYGKYLLSLIRKYRLSGQVVMLGRLDAEQMKEQFLRSSVFICASVLENSPNALGEAMLLGVPVAAFETGGIPDMLTDKQEGLLVSVGDVDGLAKAVKALWSREKDENGQTFAQRLSNAAAARAHRTHDGEINYRRLLEIYDSIGKNQ